MTDPAEIRAETMEMVRQVREALGEEACARADAVAGGWIGLLWEIERLSTAPVDDRETTTLYGKRRWLVPEGWQVEWVCPEMPQGSRCRNVEHHTIPRLVPVSPSVDPEEEP